MYIYVCINIFFIVIFILNLASMQHIHLPMCKSAQSIPNFKNMNSYKMSPQNLVGVPNYILIVKI